MNKEMICAELEYIKHCMSELVSSHIEYDPVEMVANLTDSIDNIIKEVKGE